MASNAKDIQFRELKDMISQLNATVSEQNELIRSLRLLLEQKTAKEAELQEEVNLLSEYNGRQEHTAR